MARTTDAAVRAILDDDSTIDTAPFIEVATDLVDSVCLNSGYSAAKLELIERWLAAHFYRIRDMAVDNEKAGAVAQAFQFEVDLNLNVTMYGQQAMLIDHKGNLAALNKRVKEGGPTVASITHLGTVDSDGNDTST